MVKKEVFEWIINKQKTIEHKKKRGEKSLCVIALGSF